MVDSAHELKSLPDKLSEAFGALKDRIKEQAQLLHQEQGNSADLTAQLDHIKENVSDVKLSEEDSTENITELRAANKNLVAENDNLSEQINLLKGELVKERTKCKFVTFFRVIR